MELGSLRTFVAVVDAGSITAASHQLHIAQPSLSRQIQRLERELGFSLFDRPRRRLSLSAAGRRFLPIARDLVTREALAREAAAALREGAPAAIVLSATGTTLSDVIAPFLATWTVADPLPAVWEELPATIYGSIDRGADLAIGTEPPPPHLERVGVAVLPVWAYVRHDDPWADRDSVDLAELVTRRLLVLAPEQHARVSLDRAVSRAGMSLGSMIEFVSPEVAQAVAAAGRGVAVVSDDPRFGLIPIRIAGSEDSVVVTLHAAWARDHHASHTLRSLAQRLQAFSRARYGASSET